MKISKRQLRSIVREARAKAPDDMTDAKLDAELAKSIPKDFGPRGASTIRVEPPNEKLRAPYKTGSSWETGGDAAGRYFGEDHPISGFYHPLQRYAAATIGKKEKINQTGIRSYEVQPGGPGGQWVMTFVWRDRYGRRSSERSTPIKYSENIRDTGDWNIWAAKDGIGDAIIRHLVDLGEISPESLEKLEKYWSSPNADPSPHGKPRGARAWPEPAGGMAESAIRVSKRQLQRIIREERQKLNETRIGGEFDNIPVKNPSHDLFDAVMQMYRFLVGTHNVDPERAKKMIRDQAEYALSQADTHPMGE